MINTIINLAIGMPQVVLIAIVVLLIFGGKKIPELMKGLGSGIKEFKDASKEDNSKKQKKKNSIIHTGAPFVSGLFYALILIDFKIASNSSIYSLI